MKNSSFPIAARANPNNPALRLAIIERARRAALQDHAALPGGWIAPWIERSWQRCMHRGLQPHAAVTFDVFSEAQMRHTQEANQQLVQTAKPILETLGQAIAKTRYFAILTNAEGVVIDANGPIDRSDRRADLITRIGTDLSERSVGTTAISAALTELQPVWLHRGEHFFTGTSHYSCAGAPLLDPDGTCVGMLDLTGIDVAERPELKHLVAQCASKIENALLLARAHRLMVRLNWPGSVLGGETDGVVCLDADGWITGANPIARQMLSPLTLSTRAAQHVTDVLGVPHQILFDAARRPNSRLEIPLWTGLRLQALPLERGREGQPGQAASRHRLGEKLPLKDLEIALIHQAVEQARGNVTAAARTLGISRATVYRKLGQRAEPEN